MTTTATNDICTSHDTATDVHDAHPTDCRACTVAGPTFACLSHTCPDCGSIVHATLNDRNELIHNCPPAALA